MVELSEWQICHEIVWSVSAHGRPSHTEVHDLESGRLCEYVEVIANCKWVWPVTSFQALTGRIAYTKSAYHTPMHNTMTIQRKNESSTRAQVNCRCCR
jgi:hypothetical protein